MSKWGRASAVTVVLAVAVLLGAMAMSGAPAAGGPGGADVSDVSDGSDEPEVTGEVEVLGAVEERQPAPTAEAPERAVAPDRSPDPSAAVPRDEATPSEGFDLIIGAGQSNMSGRGSPVTDELYPPHPRVFEYGAPAIDGGGEVRPAGHTLRFPDLADNTDVAGLSPLRVIGDRYADANPGRRVLLVPTAVAGSGLVADRPSGHWRPGGSGKGVNRYDAMLAHTREALAAAGPGSRIVALAWQQGESDAKIGVAEAEYAALLDEVITTVRTDLGLPDLPVVVGQMAPDWVAEATERRGVDRAHIDTPGRLERVGFGYGPTDVAWRNPDGEDDATHYSLEGIVELGEAMAAALENAVHNVASGTPARPRGLTATRDGSEVHVTWPWPASHVTDYRVEWRVGAGPWSSEGVERYTTLDTAAVIADVPPGFAQVRVATIGEVDTSHWAVTAAIG